MGDSFAERLRRLEDAEQIRQLNLAYRRHLDRRDLDAYGRLFADDGEWLGGTGYGQGPAGITAMLTERLAGNPAPPGPTSWHLVTESGVDVRGDWATGTVTWALIQRGDGDQPVMRLLGHYDDVYVRERGRWRYRRRIAYTDIPYRALDVPPGGYRGTGSPAMSGGVTGGVVPPGDIDARLGRLEDAAQIRQLTQEYRRLLDARDLDGYGRLFAEDGEWLGGTGYGQTPAGITAMLNERLPARGPGGPAAWHLITDPELSLDGDRATGTVTWTWVGRGDAGTPVMRLLGHYDDVYVRERGRWRYQRRIAHTDIPHRSLEVPAGWAGDAAAAAADSGARAGGDAEARLRRLEDLEQIRQLFVEYKMVLDKQDFAAYGALFAADGEFIATPEQGLQQAKGPAAIQALVEAMPGSLLGSGPGADFHVVVNPLIELDAADPDRAQAQVTWLYVVKGEDGAPALCKLGHYDDQLIREAGRWRFLRREAPTDIG
ncbi:MAG TPA: nuclear transport factor 2 family protein [Streptosporangiaceae bacterium]|jgi:ketosteroid isomerase-like protein|nr:nuclear transport factor 2 family protein [Streptosporangiaceae bacterium]